MIRPLLLLAISLFSTSLYPGLFKFLDLGKDGKAQQALKRLPTFIDTQKEQLARLKDQSSKLQDSEKDFSSSIQKEIEQIDKQRAEAKKERAEATGNEADFLDKKIALLNEQYQALLNMQFVRKEQVGNIEQHLILKEEFLKDPEFKSVTIKPHAFYTYSDLQKINEQMLIVDDKLRHLSQQKDEATIDLENKRRRLNTITKELQDKKKEQEAFGTKTTTPEEETDLDFRQQGILIDLELKHLELEQKLAQMRIEETKSKLFYLDSSLAIEREKLRQLRIDLSKVRSSLRIDQKDIKEAKERVEKAKKDTTSKRDDFIQDIKDLTTQKNSFLKEFDTLKDRYTKVEIPSTTLGEWSFVPTTVEQYVALCDLGFKHEQIQLQENTINHLNAQIELERAIYHDEEIDYLIQKTLYNLIHRKFKNQDEIVKELKTFQEMADEARRAEARYKDRMITASNLFTLENKALSNVKALIEELKQNKEELFKQNTNKFKFCLTRLTQVQSLIEDQIKSTQNRIKTYNTLINTLESSLQDLNSIISELEVKSIWQRSEYAISLDGIQNITTDLRLFARAALNLGTSFIAHLDRESVVSKLKGLGNPIDVALIIFKLLLILFLFGLLRKFFEVLHDTLLTAQPASKFLLILSRTGAAILSFLIRHFIGIYIWTLIYVLIKTEVVSDLFLQVIFYLASIIYFCYLTKKFIDHFLHFNASHEYVIFGQGFQKRFAFVFSLISYLTIILLFLREAFIAATYHASEFPTIIMAVYSIIVRTLIIFSIGKDEILSLIPSKGAGWKALSDFIDQYYYPLLVFIIVIMIMSDPYVGGYGNLVSYVFWGVIGSAVLIKLLLLAQSFLRKKSSHLFFFYEDDEVRERFSYATTWFGLYVIALFILILFVGLIFGLRIWGHNVTLVYLWDRIVDAKLFQAGYDEASGTYIWVTPIRILGIVGYILAGFGIAFAINKFVIRRIFHLLPVDLGIQNTVTSLVRYLIIITAIFFGFQMAGLGTLLIAIGLAIGSIAYINKEPIADFISYFIILVQRPVKIGDYIVIDKTKGISGVVRQITARSTVIRSKNSFSVVMPNTSIINQPIKNWNYSGVFIALDDMNITIPYSIDPEKVKIAIENVCKANTDILRTPQPIIRLDDFGENGYIFMLRAFISSTKTLQMWDIASDVRFAMIKELQKYGIAIAFPTRVIISAPQSKKSPEGPPAIAPNIEGIDTKNSDG